MKTNLKNNIWIEGFDKQISMINVIDMMDNHPKNYNVIWSGKTSEIPAEIAKKYFDYGYDDSELHFTSVNDSIKEACKQYYCIIYKQ